MNKAQRRVVMIAGVVAVLMLVLPPWETPGGHYLGHALIAAPPGASDLRPESLRWALPAPEPIGRVSVRLLAAQYAALLAVAGAAFHFLGSARRE